MSLFGLIDYEGSSSSSSESDEDTATEEPGFSILDNNAVKTGQEEDEQLILPSPLLETSEPALSKEFKTRTYQQASIFYNPFKAEEKRKLEVLEKHVQLTKNVPSSKNNKRICYKFQKGKCKYGDNCKFAHPTNIIKTETVSLKNDVTKLPEENAHITKKETPYDPDKEEDQWEVEAKTKKRRIGVSDSLIPPKRAMMAFEHQKNKSKP